MSNGYQFHSSSRSLDKPPVPNRRTRGLFTLLVVDNDADQWAIIDSALARSFPEAEPVWVADPDQALSYLDQVARTGKKLPQLVVQELYLPHRVDGQALIRAIKSHPSYRLIPVVVLSHSREEEDILDAYDQGVASFITKPATDPEWLACFSTFRRYWLGSVTLLPHSWRPSLVSR